MAEDKEQIGFHKGALTTLAKERQEPCMTISSSKMNILKKASIYNKTVAMSESESENTIRQTIDLGIAWTWKYDASFISALVAACETAGATVLEIRADTVGDVTQKVSEGSMRFRWFFDRASDEDESFRPLSSFCLSSHRSIDAKKISFINPTDEARRAADKATMHLEFITHGIHVPHTVILPAQADTPTVSIPDEEMSRLGSPFVIKPANTTGGGVGVIMNASSMSDVEEHRSTFKDDKYLLQAKVSPVYLSEARAWFRVFYACGETWLCWWDDQTHVYDSVSADEERWFGLEILRSAMDVIAEICRLDFFSSEFAQTADGTFVSVDYVNELCDMRPKSTTPDGVPDMMIGWVAQRLAARVSERKVKSN